jgi:hypothetical protein
MTNQRIVFLLLRAALLVAPSVSFGVSGVTAGRSADASSSRAKPTLFAVNVGSHLHYRNDKEDQNFPFVSNSVAIARPNRAEPRVLLDPRELPRHSPSPETLKEQKVLMDMEMVIGRLFMVAALIFFAGEVSSGLSITDQLTGVF